MGMYLFWLEQIIGCGRLEISSTMLPAQSLPILAHSLVNPKCHIEDKKIMSWWWSRWSWWWSLWWWWSQWWLWSWQWRWCVCMTVHLSMITMDGWYSLWPKVSRIQVIMYNDRWWPDDDDDDSDSFFVSIVGLHGGLRWWYGLTSKPSKPHRPDSNYYSILLVFEPTAVGVAGSVLCFWSIHLCDVLRCWHTCYACHCNLCEWGIMKYWVLGTHWFRLSRCACASRHVFSILCIFRKGNGSCWTRMELHRISLQAFCMYACVSFSLIRSYWASCILCGCCFLWNYIRFDQYLLLEFWSDDLLSGFVKFFVALCLSGRSVCENWLHLAIRVKFTLTLLCLRVLIRNTMP